MVLGIPIAYRFGNTIAAAVTLNISRGGVAVRTTNPLDKGIVVKTRFRMPMGKKDIDVESKVAWSDKRVGMGLEFIGPRAEDQQRHRRVRRLAFLHESQSLGRFAADDQI